MDSALSGDFSQKGRYTNHVIIIIIIINKLFDTFKYTQVLNNYLTTKNRKNIN